MAVFIAINAYRKCGLSCADKLWLLTLLIVKIPQKRYDAASINFL